MTTTPVLTGNYTDAQEQVTHLTGVLWGFPFTLAAMFGKHPELRGGKVLEKVKNAVKGRTQRLSTKPPQSQDGECSSGMLPLGGPHPSTGQ